MLNNLSLHVQASNQPTMEHTLNGRVLLNINLEVGEPPEPGLADKIRLRSPPHVPAGIRAGLLRVDRADHSSHHSADLSVER